MKRFVVIMLLVVLALGTAGSLLADAPTDFSLKDTNGRNVRLSDYLGSNVILINFWATWCVPCQQELPTLESLYQRYQDRGLVVLGIAVDGPASTAGVNLNARRLGLTFPILLDRETRVVAQYNPRQEVPFTVVVGRDGAIHAVHEGYSPGDERVVEREVVQLLEVSNVIEAEDNTQAEETN